MTAVRGDDLLHDLSAVEQVSMIASGELSSRELVEHYLDRIERHDNGINAFLAVFADEALVSAKAADDAVARGDTLGLLHGLPLALKDLHASAGLPTTFGSAVFQGLVPTVDAPAVGNLRNAGAVVVGKTNVPEFGPTCYTDNKVKGATANPYDLRLSPSGSSGGAAAAVAAGLIGIAHGSDGLGSIRTPAAACGLVGFKTSRGRSAGSGSGFLAIAVEGPLARTVGDAALFLDAMGPAGSGDLWQGPAVAPRAFTLAAAVRAPRGLRVGVLTATGQDLEVHGDCLAGLDLTARALEAAGYQIEEVPASAIPAAHDVRAAIRVMLNASIGQVVQAAVPTDQRHLLMPYTRWLFESGSYSASDYATAQAVITIAAIRFRDLLSTYDLIISPTTTAPPLPTSELRADDGAGSLEAMARWSAFTPAANLAGTPAVSLPVHYNAEGLPIGVQVMAPQFHDELLMSVAAELEEAFGWQRTHPAMWAI